jgi:hypothetical protein
MRQDGGRRMPMHFREEDRISHAAQSRRSHEAVAPIRSRAEGVAMIRPRPRNLFTTGILLLGLAGCAGLRRESPPAIGPGVVPRPVTTSTRPVDPNAASPFAEPGGGIGRFVPGRYPQLKEGAKPSSRWVDPFVKQRKSQPDSTQLAQIFPQRQPIGSRRIGARLNEDEGPIEALPIALNIAVYPDDEPIETARSSASTRRLSSRVEPEVRPSRWRVPQSEREGKQGDAPAEPIAPQARVSPRMPEVPREPLSLEIPQGERFLSPSLRRDSAALIDPPVEPASATVEDGGLLEIPSAIEPEASRKPSPPDAAPSEAPAEAQADEPISLPPIEMVPDSVAVEPVHATPSPPETAAAPEITAEVEAGPDVAATPEITPEPAPTPEVETAPEVAAEPTPAPEVAITPEITAEQSPESEGSPDAAPTPEASIGAATEKPQPVKESEVEPIRVAIPHPAAMTDPPPFVPGASLDITKLPHPPLPSRSMIAVTPAPAADPATIRIATETDAQAPAAKPARRSLWSRFRRESPVPAASQTEEPTRVSAVPFHSAGLAETSPLFPPSYYSQGVEATRDDQAQQASVPSGAPTEKPRRFRLFHRFFGE